MTRRRPDPGDESTAQAVVYATITCFPSGAADSVTRSADAAKAAGQTVTARDDLGDQAFSATDPSNATFLQLRHGDVVVYLAASGEATPAEVDTLASAFDKALGGDGGQVAVGHARRGVAPGARRTAATSPSDAAEARSARPRRRSRRRSPATVGDITLGKDSATGADVLGDDPGGPGGRRGAAGGRATSRPTSWSRYASDEAGAADLTITGLSVDGMGAKALRDLALSAWLPAIRRRA